MSFTIEGNDDFDASAAFLSNLTSEEPKEPKEAPEKPAEAPESPPEGASSAQPEEGAGDASEATQEAGEVSEDPDDAEVDFTRGDKTEKVKLRELKDALREREETKRVRQETEEHRQRTEQVHTRASTALTKLLEKAKAKLEPFSQLDYVTLVKNPEMDAESLTYIRQEHQKALEDVKFLETELDGAVQTAQAAQAAQVQQAAMACLAALNDAKSPHHITGFGRDVYNDMMRFAHERGVSVPFLNGLTDPAAIKLIHEAMLYQRGKAAASPTKVVKKPTNVLKPGTGKSPPTGSKAKAALVKSGSLDDAAAAFLENLGAASGSSE